MHNTFAVCPAPAHLRHGLTVRASARHAPSPLENAVPPTLQTVSLRPPRPPVHAHTQPRKRGHRALVEMMGLRLAPLDQVASMRHLEEHEQLRDGALQHLPHQRSGREGRRKWQRHGPTGLCKSVISGTRDLGGSILPPIISCYMLGEAFEQFCFFPNIPDHFYSLHPVLYCDRAV